jgi:hypothetical protein
MTTCAALFCHLYEMGISGPFLVVAPLSTIPNWLNEFKRFAPKVFFMKNYEILQSVFIGPSGSVIICRDVNPDLNPNPSVIKQKKGRKTLITMVLFSDFFMTFYL